LNECEEQSCEDTDAILAAIVNVNEFFYQ